ncbi:MAG: EamA family transporter [Candidatus Bipolaricaulaceae bacterium]
MGHLALLGAAALWGLIGPVSRLAFREGLAPLEVAFFRAALAWPLFLAHALWQKRVRVRARDLLFFVPFGFVGITAFYGAYQLAIRFGGAALAAVLLYTAPIWVALLAPWLLGERLTPRTALATALAFLGVALVSNPRDANFHPLGLGFGLLSGLAYALYYLWGKRFLARYPIPQVFAYALPVGAAALLPLVEFHSKSLLAWGALVFLAVFCTYGAYTLYFAGLRRLPATRAVILATLEPVIAALVARAWWGETLSPTRIVGAALILGAALLGSRGAACRRGGRGI